MAGEDDGRQSEENGGRDLKGRFTTGNPGGGRPPEAKALKAWARGVIENKGMTALEDMITGEGEDRRFAIKIVLEYGYGKPTQNVDLTSGGLPLIKALVGDDLALLELPPPGGET